MASISPCPSWHLFIVCFCMLSIRLGGKWYLTVVLSHIALMAKAVTHSFMYLLAIHTSPLGKYLLKSLAHFLIGLLDVWPLSYKHFSYILDASPYFTHCLFWLANIVFPSVGCLLHACSPSPALPRYIWHKHCVNLRHRRCWSGVLTYCQMMDTVVLADTSFVLHNYHFFVCVMRTFKIYCLSNFNIIQYY